MKVLNVDLATGAPASLSPSLGLLRPTVSSAVPWLWLFCRLFAPPPEVVGIEAAFPDAEADALSERADADAETIEGTDGGIADTLLDVRDRI